MSVEQNIKTILCLSELRTSPHFYAAGAIESRKLEQK